MKLEAEPPAAKAIGINTRPVQTDELGRSNLYAFFRRELEEINRHKWLESEKAGRDLGFEWALLDWVRRHRSEWRRALRSW